MHGVGGDSCCGCGAKGSKVPEAHLLAAKAEAKSAAEAAHKHRGEVSRLRAELDGLNRQLEQTCTLRLQPSDALDSQARTQIKLFQQRMPKISPIPFQIQAMNTDGVWSQFLCQLITGLSVHRESSGHA